MNYPFKLRKLVVLSALSSPHLVHVRERIRIDGWPISKQLFTKYFWETYEQLEDTKVQGSVHLDLVSVPDDTSFYLR